MRFKIIHLLVALTITALVAILIRQYNEDRVTANTLVMVTLFGAVTGTAVGFAWGGTALKPMSRWRLTTLAAIVGLFTLLGLVVQRGSLSVIEHADNEFAPIITCYARLNGYYVFDIFTVVVTIALAWGVIIGSRRVVRTTAAVSIACWLAIFALGYLAAAHTAVYWGPLR